MPKADKNVAYRRKSVDLRRQELVAAGIACLGQGGMSAFTIDRICRQAGVSRGLVNHHFKSKQDLLVRIYDDMTEHLVIEAEYAEPKTQLARIVETSFDENSFNRSNLRAWLAMWGQVPSNPALKSLHRERYREYRRRIERALRAIRAADGVENGQQDATGQQGVARQLIAMIDGLWLEYCLNSDDFTLADAKRDCFAFLRARGIECEPCEGRQAGP